MKVALLALLVANVLAAIAGWYVTDPTRAPRDPRARELEPQRVRIVAPAEARAASTARPRACIEWGGFTLADSQRAERSIEALGVGLRPAERRVEGGAASWWVYAAPLANRRAADRLADDLRRAGVGDYYVVQDPGPFLNAVSLGLFSTEGGANARRDQLFKLGFRDLVVQTRENTTTRFWLRLRDVPGGVVTRINALRTDFAGSELRDCS